MLIAMSESLLGPIAPTVAAPSGAERLLEALVQHGVDTIFGYPGGAALPLYDALYSQPRCGTSWCAMSRPPCTRPKAMRAAPAGSASCW